MYEKICSFCGHRTVITKKLEEKVNFILCDLIKNKNYTVFYSGGMGEFDKLCEKVVHQLKKQYPHIKLYRIMYRYSVHIEDVKPLYDEIIIPELGDAHYKKIITLRNQWMSNNSNAVLCYIYKNYGGAYSMMRYAQKINKEIIMCQ